MRNRIATVGAAALVVAGLAACTSGAEPSHPSQATVTINGHTVANKQRVTCVQQQWYWTIKVGDQDVSGVKAMVKGSGESLVANSVHIRNLGGFTGVYSQDNGGSAEANFANATFTITGTAEGFNSRQPDRPAEATFEIVATC